MVVSGYTISGSPKTATIYYSDGNGGNLNGEDTTFDPQQLFGKWQADSWETLLSSNDPPYKVVGFEYLPLNPPNSAGETDYTLFKLHRTQGKGGGGSGSFNKDAFFVKHNIFYYNGWPLIDDQNETIPIFSCSISGDTLTLTAITVDRLNVVWPMGYDIKAGEVFFTGKKVEEFDWRK